MTFEGMTACGVGFGSWQAVMERTARAAVRIFFGDDMFGLTFLGALSLQLSKASGVPAPKRP